MQRISRLISWLIKWLSCMFGHHNWTCAASKGVKPTTEQLTTGLDGFWDYAKMYCDDCGIVSQLSLRDKEKWKNE